MTGLTGAGPAYPALLPSAMLRHAKDMGIADYIALEAVMQTLTGGSRLLAQLDRDPGDMVNRLIEYRGTTAQCLQCMIDEDFIQRYCRGECRFSGGESVENHRISPSESRLFSGFN